MNFGQRLREFRKHELGIKVNEAAYRIGVSPTAYSNYELGARAIPLHLLPILKDKFGISDTLFLDMLLDRKTVQVGKTPQQLTSEINDLRERYNAYFSKDYYDFLVKTPDLREFIGMLASLDTKKRIFTLNAIRHIVQVNIDLLRKIEKLEAQNSDKS